MPLLLAFVLLALADHLGAFASHGDPWWKFDRAAATVTRVIDGATIEADVRGEKTVVRLLGIKSADDARASLHLESLVAHKPIRLKLEPLQPRDREGHLLAYVFVNEIDNVNLEMIREGFAKTDRTREHTFARMFQTAESVARKAKRGIWDGE